MIKIKNKKEKRELRKTKEFRRAQQALKVEAGEKTKFKFNIQQFAGAVGVNGHKYGNIDISEGQQAKYNDMVVRALGNTGIMPLMDLFQKDQSTNAAYSIFYTSGTLTARDKVQVTYDAENRPGMVAGQSKDGFLKSVRIIPTGIDCPIYIGEDDFEQSRIDEDSIIKDAQVNAIMKKSCERVAGLLKDVHTNMKRVVTTSEGGTYEVVVPAGNVFGDPTKSFDENLKAFFLMMRTAVRSTEGTSRKVAIITGLEGETELSYEERFSNKDWTEKGTTVTGMPQKVLLGGEVRYLPEYDKAFYPLGTETVGVITVVIQNALGHDNKKALTKTTIHPLPHMQSVYMNALIQNNTELLQGEGVYFFRYLK